MEIQNTLNLLKPHFGQVAIAHHEAAHAVISLVLEGGLGCASLSVWRNFDAEHESWSGITRGLEFRSGDGLTPDTAWGEILAFAAGPCGNRHFEGAPLSPEDIWGDGSAFSDAPMARQLAEYFWPRDSVDDVLEAGAAYAAALVTRPDAWRAIAACADYAAVRRDVSVTELEILVRRFVPQPIKTPGLDWAVSLIP